MDHQVELNAEELEVTKAGVTFHIHDSNKKVGSLEVRKGSIVWHSKNMANKNAYTMSWEEFDDAMKKSGRKS